MNPHEGGDNSTTTPSAAIASFRPGWTLPGLLYTDPALYALEVQKIWQRRWLFCGHSCEVTNPGDFRTFEIANESLIVMRDDAGNLGAFFNVCRHRGSRLCTTAGGHVGKLVCPYHQWTYDRDGALNKAPFAPAGFATESLGLHRAHCREVAGLVFVCLGDNPPDFEPARRAIEPQLLPQGLGAAKIAAQREYEVRANWKVIFENNRECYHCIVNHPEYSVANFAGSVLVKPELQQQFEAIHAQKVRHWESQGVPCTTVDFQADRWFRAARAALRPGCVSETIDGKPVSSLMGSYAEPDMGSLRILTFPNFYSQASSDYAMTTQILPAGPGVTRVRVCWLVDAKAKAGVDYDPARVTEVWERTSAQDWELCENNQRGIESSRYEPGPLLTTTESGVGVFDAWYIEQMRD